MPAKRFDNLFKTLAEENLPAFLWLFAGRDLKPGDRVEALPRELHMPALAMDQVVLLKLEGARDEVLLFEAKARADRESIRQLSKYSVIQFALLDFETQITPLLVLFAPGFPIQDRFVADGPVAVEVRPLVVRLWEMEAERVLESSWPHLLPWTPLLKGGRKVLQETAKRIAKLRDRRLALRLAIEFLTLGALRYDIDELRQLLEHLKMFIPQELIDESPFYQRVKRETRAEALAEGRVEGRVEGRAEAEAELLRALLTHRFPELVAEASAISGIKDPQRLQALFEAVLKAETAQDAQRAFRNNS